MTTDTRMTVLITGAGVGGIGGALAKEFHAQGYRVFAAARRAEAVAPLVDMGIEHIQLDVTIADEVEAAKEEVSKRTGGKLDVLVNNAGVGGPMPALDTDLDTTIRPMFEANVFGVMRMSQTFAPLLISAAKAGEEAPVIVNICSLASTYPLPFSAHYAATKAAVQTYGDCLRMELQPFGVDVLNVITGGVKSNIVRSSHELPEGSLYQPAIAGFKERVHISQHTGMETAAYAKYVVGKVLKGRRQWWWLKNRWIWSGSTAALSKFAYHLMPRALTETVLMRKFGLWDLKKAWFGSQQKKLP